MSAVFRLENFARDSSSLSSVDGEGHPAEIKMQMKVLWSAMLLLAVTPAVLSQSGTALLNSSIATVLLNTSPSHSSLLP